MRERQIQWPSHQAGAGITPACAGKTGTIERKGENYQDHPRMCGKDPIKLAVISSMLGSPPHVRERPITLSADLYEAGITPACAGKTSFRNGLHTATRDHPRMCGKDDIAEVSKGTKKGSPPHVRERPS